MPTLFTGAPGRTLYTFLPALVLLAASCASAGQQGNTTTSTSQAPTPADIAPPSGAQQADRFAAERALGADCSGSWISDPPLQRVACYGMLPAHVAAFLRTIPDSHPHLAAEFREEQAAKKQRFVFVEGYGERPDVLASIYGTSAFWIRSFEGPDPDVTVYVVYGPGCDDSPRMRPRSIGEGCLPGHPYVVRAIRIYRVRSGKAPEDVTSELAPPAPVLTPAERERYGIYIRPPEEGDAHDNDVGLDIRGLDTTPVMRWVIAPAEEGDYEKPHIPDSDPRGFLRQAHFGFLVWTGMRFELRERIPLTLWACGVGDAGGGDCLERFAGGLDPYLIEGPTSATQEGDTP